jgi:hypothetical protein
VCWPTRPRRDSSTAHLSWSGVISGPQQQGGPKTPITRRECTPGGVQGEGRRGWWGLGGREKSRPWVGGCKPGPSVQRPRLCVFTHPEREAVWTRVQVLRRAWERAKKVRVRVGRRRKRGCLPAGSVRPRLPVLPQRTHKRRQHHQAPVRCHVKAQHCVRAACWGPRRVGEQGLLHKANPARRAPPERGVTHQTTCTAIRLIMGSGRSSLPMCQRRPKASMAGMFAPPAPAAGPLLGGQHPPTWRCCSLSFSSERVSRVPARGHLQANRWPRLNARPSAGR